MKNRLFLLLCAMLLSACADKEQYKQAVLEQMQKEQDVKDYKLSAEDMTECVLDTTSDKMPGLFAFAPERLTAYRNYAKMLNLLKSNDPKKAMEELRADFGSPKELADAHANYTESLLECYSGMITGTEQEQGKGKEEAPKQP